MGLVYLYGIWTVKTGQEDEFVRRWEEGADWAIRNIEGVGPGTLVQDKAQPSRFLSFGPFDSVEAVEKWRGHPEIKERQARLAGLVDGLDRGMCDLRAQVG